MKQLLQSRPMRTLPLFVILLLPVLSGSGARAETVTDLYSVTVPVDSYTAEERNRATREGLAQVLVRLTGDSRSPVRPNLAGELENAPSYVLQFGYSSLPGEVEGDSVPAVTIDFSEVAINGLLRRNEVPVWPANRPLVLVWLVTDTADQGRHFISTENYTSVYQRLNQTFARRAVPLQLPLLDLRDEMLLSPEAAWNFDTAAVRAAADRYKAGLSIVLRFYQTSAGYWRGAWLLEGEDISILESARADSLEEMVAATSELIIDRVAPRYTYAPTSTAEAVSLVVQGVQSFTDFSQVLAWFAGLEIVKDVQIKRATGDSLYLDLQIEGDAAVLQQAIQQDSHLRPVIDQSELSPLAAQRLLWLGVAD